jgi:hypothetical protein
MWLWGTQHSTCVCVRFVLGCYRVSHPVHGAESNHQIININALRSEQKRRIIAFALLQLFECLQLCSGSATMCVACRLRQCAARKDSISLEQVVQPGRQAGWWVSHQVLGDAV